LLARGLLRSTLARSLHRRLHWGFLTRSLHRASGYGAARRSDFATAVVLLTTATIAVVTTTATTVATAVATTVVMTTATAGRLTTAVVSAATAVAAGAVAAMATMTSNSLAVRTQQGNSDNGEKHRHAQKNNSIHFCIPPFDSQVGVTTKKLPSSHLASNAGEFKEEEPIPPCLH
jgi:hypothetical protein